MFRCQISKNLLRFHDHYYSFEGLNPIFSGLSPTETDTQCDVWKQNPKTWPKAAVFIRFTNPWIPLLMNRLEIGLKTFEEIVLDLKYFCRRLPWRVFILLNVKSFCEGRIKRRLIEVTVWRHLRRYQLNFSLRSHFWSQFFDFFMLLSIDLTSSGHISFIDEFFPTFESSQKDQSPAAEFGGHGHRPRSVTS